VSWPFRPPFAPPDPLTPLLILLILVGEREADEDSVDVDREGGEADELML
jgi:hypothetical protein